MPVPGSSILPTLDDLKQHINEASATNDAELQDFLDTAAELVARYVGPLDAETVTEKHRYPTRGPLVLRRTPVLSVTSVTDFDDTAMAASDYDLDGDAGLLYLAYGGAYSSWHTAGVTVVYEAGRTALPDPIRTAIFEVVRDMISGTQTGAGAREYGQDLEGPGFTSGRPVLPPYVLGLLEPYLLGPVVA